MLKHLLRVRFTTAPLQLLVVMPISLARVAIAGAPNNSPQDPEFLQHTLLPQLSRNVGGRSPFASQLVLIAQNLLQKVLLHLGYEAQIQLLALVSAIDY